MIRFEHTEYLWLLAGVAFLGILWGVTRWLGRQRRERWANREMWGRLIPDERKWRPITKTVLVLLGLSLIVVALVNPLMGIKQENGKRSGSDIAICLDVSNSMMAEDVKPNRLARSKQVVNNLLNSMTGDRVSLIVFAGTSFIEMPLTNDYNAAKLFLDQVDCSMISTQGTAIGDAIENAMATFGYGDKDREWTTTGSRAIIVISDGENHEDDAIGAAKEAAKQGVRVCAIGLGSTKGARIPGKNNGTYLRDHNGNIITTRLNEQMLKDISNAGKGAYVNGSNGIKEVTSLLESLEKNDFDEQIFNSFESRYQYPLAAGLFLLLLELLIFERRNKKWRLAFLFLFLFLGNVQGQESWRKPFKEGNALYRQQQYLEASEQYLHVLEDTTLSDENRAKVLYNLGNSTLRWGREHNDDQSLEKAVQWYNESLNLNNTDFRTYSNLGHAYYMQQIYDSAAMAYSNALAGDDLTDQQQARTSFNLGNSLLRQAQTAKDTSTLKTAISCYRNALKLDPTNDDYRYNQSLAYRLLDKWTHHDSRGQQQDKQKKQEQQKKEEQKQKQQQQQDKQQQDKQQQKQQDKQQQKQQGGQQQKEQKKKSDSKKLNDEVNKELQRQQQKQQQSQQQQQKNEQQKNEQQNKQGKQGNNKKESQQQKTDSKADSQQNNNQGQQQEQKQSEKQGQGKEAKKSQEQKKSDKQKLNDEIKKEIERQKQQGKGDASKKTEKRKNEKPGNEQHPDKNNLRQQQNPMNGSPQTGKKNNGNKKGDAQQGTILTGKKLDPDKKNAEVLLEAVKNNERKTLKTQMENGLPIKGSPIEKEW